MSVIARCTCLEPFGSECCPQHRRRVPRDAAREALAEILHQRFCQCGTPWSLVADRFFSKASDWYVHADAVRAAFAGTSPTETAPRDAGREAGERAVGRMLDRIAYWSTDWMADDEGRRDALARISAELPKLRAAIAGASPPEPSLREMDIAEGIKDQAIGKRLAYFREREGLSQSGLARIVGASQSAISQIESGDRYPSYGMLLQLADGCGVSLARLVGDGDRAARLTYENGGRPTRGEYADLAGLPPSSAPPPGEQDTT